MELAVNGCPVVSVDLVVLFSTQTLHLSEVSVQVSLVDLLGAGDELSDGLRSISVQSGLVVRSQSQSLVVEVAGLGGHLGGLVLAEGVVQGLAPLTAGGVEEVLQSVTDMA